MLHKKWTPILSLLLLFPAGPEGTTRAEPDRTARSPAGRTSPYRQRIAPPVRQWFRSPGYRMVRGALLPGGPAAARRLRRVAVTIRLASEEHFAGLQRAVGPDLAIRSCGGQPCRLGLIVSALVGEPGLRQLRRLPGVTRVELDMIHPTPPPLDLTVPEVDAPEVWGTTDANSVAVTGAGVVIADIDSGIDVMHPSFFRADGGTFSWIDVNGNNTFDPGTDAVDLDANGLADDGETLEFFDGEAYSLYLGYLPVLDSDDGRFDVGWDHLYADRNGNGERDFGPDGFTEGDATYGEPIFLVDDVNGNGALDPGEKLVALGTSKIRAVKEGHTEWERGVDLIEVPVTDDSMHGNGVAGILVGGTPGLTTLTGVAPGAELLLASTRSEQGSLTDLLIWAVQQGADVVLHEYAPWVGTHLDGSTNHEAVMDQAADQGVAQVNPAGNLGGSEKHCRADLGPSSSLVLPVVVPPNQYPGYPEYAVKYIETTFHWRRPDRNPTFVIETPGGEIVDLGTAGDSGYLADGTTAYFAYRDDSPRGTAMFDLYVWGEEGPDLAPIPVGAWTLTVTDPDATGLDPDPAPLSGYVMDDVSSWGVGARFGTHVSEEHLICFPATADSAIGVAAYTGHDAPPYDQPDSEPSGQLRRFSGRGTRIDDAPVLDIAAPDNPLTPISPMDLGGGYEVPTGAYMVFGGTSGAGPHVAGTVALLKQVAPDLDGLEVRQALRDGALVDADVTGDASHDRAALWGAGKLRAFATLYGESPAPNTPPTIAVAPSTATVGAVFSLAPTVSDAEDPTPDLQLRWDVDYDGAWDGAPIPADTALETTFTTPGTRFVKVEVVDTGGLTAAALVEVQVSPATDGGDAGPQPPPPDNGCGCASAAPGAALPPLLLLLLFVCLRRGFRL